MVLSDAGAKLRSTNVGKQRTLKWDSPIVKNSDNQLEMTSGLSKEVWEGIEIYTGRKRLLLPPTHDFGSAKVDFTLQNEARPRKPYYNFVSGKRGHDGRDYCQQSRYRQYHPGTVLQ